MAIDIGDAILNCLVDTTQADAGLNAFGAGVEAKLAPARDALGRFTGGVTEAGAAAGAAGEKGVVAGTSLADAFRLLPPVAAQSDAALQNMAFALTGVGAATAEVTASMHEAKGGISLVNEIGHQAFGISLPRHVRTFLAELQGVQNALSLAFSAGVVFFLLEALVKGLDKIHEWAQASELQAQAQEKIAQTFHDTDEKIQSGIDKQKQKFIELTQGPVAALDFELKHMGDVGAEAFRLLEKELDETAKNFLERAGIFNLFGTANEDLREFQSKLGEAIRTADEAHPQDPTAGLRAGLTLTVDKIQGLNVAIGGIENAAGHIHEPINASTKALIEERDALERVNHQIQALIESTRKRQDTLGEEKAVKAADLEAQAAKRNYEEQIASIEKWKATQHEAYVSGQTDASAWKVAEVQAAEASRIAHEHYLERLVALYRQSGQTLKEHAAAEELATLKTKDAAKETETLAQATEKYHQATLKIVKEWENLQNAAIVKDFEATAKATEHLTRAEEELSKAQTKLAEAKIGENFKEQEAAITKLAELGIIKEEQKQQKLLALHKQEEDQALAVLKDQLAKEQAVLTAAQVKVSAAQGNPFFTNAQVFDLKKNLTQAETAVLNTQAKITQTEGKFQQQRLAELRGGVAQAVAILLVAGKQEQAEALKNAAAQLAVARAELTTAKARGQNTAAILKEIKAQEQHIKDLEKETRDLKTNETEINKNSNVVVSAKAQEAAAWIGSGIAAMEAAGSFEAAGQALVKSVLGSIAGYADKKGTEQLAIALALLGDPFALDTPGHHFASAALWFGLGGVASLAGGAVGGGGSSGGGSGKSSSSGSAIDRSSSVNQPAQNPVQTINVVHLASGALVTAPTLALVGDSQLGGSGREAVLPLDNAGAMKAIASALSEQMHMHGAGGGDIYITLEPGMNTTKLVHKISRDVNRGKLRLKASDSLRTTRRY